MDRGIICSYLENIVGDGDGKVPGEVGSRAFTRGLSSLGRGRVQCPEEGHNVG
jgi:hypothetical protein